MTKERYLNVIFFISEKKQNDCYSRAYETKRYSNILGNTCHLLTLVSTTVSHTKDLGVVVSTNLSPSAHVNDIAARAHKRANMILRTFVSQDVSLLIRAWFMPG